MDTAISINEERRGGPDRRRASTSIFSALRWGGRRKRFRRQSEGVNTYVDCPTTEVLSLVFFVVLASALDALFTLLHMQSGASEANPAMRWLIEVGIEPFVYVKLGLTAVGCSLLAIHQLFPLGIRALRLLAIAYTLLLGYHGFLFLS